MVNPFASVKLTFPIPGGPGKTTTALTAPGLALAGMANVAETCAPVREIAVP